MRKRTKKIATAVLSNTWLPPLRLFSSPKPLFLKLVKKPVLMDELIYAQVSPRSQGLLSLFDAPVIHSENVKHFHSNKEITQAVVKHLSKLGFEVLEISPITLTIRGSKDVYERAFGQTIVKPDPENKERVGTDYIFKETGSPVLRPKERSNEKSLNDSDILIEGIALSSSPMLLASPDPPNIPGWYLTPNFSLPLALQVNSVHQAGIKGRGVEVLMIDTGFEQVPYYTNRNFNIRPNILGPGAEHVAIDENGHGTAMAACLLAAAPEASLRMMKRGGDFTGAINRAINTAPKPRIISCSWGHDIIYNTLPPEYKPLEAAVAEAIRQGITMVFAAGNGDKAFPAQMPEVIAVGGVYMQSSQHVIASNYASGYRSAIYPNRIVPDICGYVGQKPEAAFILLPTADGSELDRLNHHALGSTSPNDGWIMASGTSAAAAQVAGVCALLLQADPSLTSRSLKQLLGQTALDVTSGISALGTRAGNNLDLATGHGLVNACAAYSKIIGKTCVNGQIQ
jgi:serine protease AprX